jgi:hypothetical protein
MPRFAINSGRSDGPASAVEEAGLDIRLMQQPGNSPDMNALDLGFFSSMQSLTLCFAPTTLKELIKSVEQAFDAYDVHDFMYYRECS